MTERYWVPTSGPLAVPLCRIVGFPQHFEQLIEGDLIRVKFDVDDFTWPVAPVHTSS